jgi:hypothetical protein
MSVYIKEAIVKSNSLFNRMCRPWLKKIKSGSRITAEEWEQRNKDNKEEYPIRYKLFHDVPDKIRDAYWDVSYSLKAAKNFIRFRTWDRYHVIKISDKPDYMTHRRQMLNASFSILVDFVETNLPDYRGVFSYLRKDWYLDCEHFNPPDTTPEKKKETEAWVESHYEIAQKILELYLWWTVEIPSQEAGCYYNFFPAIIKNSKYHISSIYFGNKTYKEETGVFFLEEKFDKLFGNSIEKDDEEFQEYNQKLKELYMLWEHIVD